MDLTVAVCTAGERATLQDALASLVTPAVSTTVAFEILVVDNSRTDTDFVRQATDRAAPRAVVPVRYIRERRPGLAAARNAALAAAEGAVVAYLDDDALASPSWVQELWKVYQGRDAAAVGGRIHLKWLADRPAWLEDRLLGYLGQVDYGPAVRTCHFPLYPFGGNISFRREEILAMGGFDPVLGVVGSQGYLAEEVELCARLERVGRPVLYAPGAEVWHLVPASRLTRRYFFDRSARSGRSAARMAHSAGTGGRPRPFPARSFAKALGYVCLHGVRGMTQSLSGNERETMSEWLHLGWNLAWLRETTALTFQGREQRTGARTAGAGDPAAPVSPRL